MTTLTLVYVEDNEGDMRLLEEAIRESAIALQLVPFSDARAAQQYFAFKSTARDVPPPDAVLIDLRLQHLEGRDLIAFLLQAEAFRRIPIYAITGDRRCHDDPAALGVPPARCLCKPTDWAGLLALVERLWMEMREGRAG